MLGVIGRGTFCEVVSRGASYEEQVAIKVFEKSRLGTGEAKSRLDNEIACLSRLKRHPNLLQLLEVVEDEERIYLITEHRAAVSSLLILSRMECLTRRPSEALRADGARDWRVPQAERRAS